MNRVRAAAVFEICLNGQGSAAYGECSAGDSLLDNDDIGVEIAVDQKDTTNASALGGLAAVNEVASLAGTAVVIESGFGNQSGHDPTAFGSGLPGTDAAYGGLLVESSGANMGGIGFTVKSNAGAPAMWQRGGLIKDRNNVGLEISWVGDQELLSYLSTADVCLAPDPPVRFNQLSTFIKLMEYMSCGKVTVCFDLLESRRTAGDTAVFVGRDDPAEFAEAIEQILDDGRRRCEMGNAARERSLRLHWGISQEVLIGTYEKLFSAQ